MSYTLAEMTKLIGGVVRGDGERQISGIATITDAGPQDITFLANPGYRKYLASTQAGAIIARRDDIADSTVDAIISDNPYVCFAKVAALFSTDDYVGSGTHPTASIADTAVLDPTAQIGAHAVVESGVQIGARTYIGSGTVVESDAIIGNDCRIQARVTLCQRTRLGNRVIIHSGAVIGADGFGLAFDGGSQRWLKVPQLGSVVIGDDCEIGANTTIDRGALGDTVLEEDVRLDNQIQIAHNVHIGAHTAMAGCSAVAGSTRIGRNCLIGGGAGILGHLEIADKVTITAMSLVTHSLTAAGEYSSGSPLQINQQWRKNAVRIKQLDKLARRVTKLER